MSERCAKPGCGALRLVGKPCTDGDCPQRWVSHSDYASLDSALAAATRECEQSMQTIAMLREALEKIAKWGTVAGMHAQDRDERLREIARAALQGGNDGSE